MTTSVPFCYATPVSTRLRLSANSLFSGGRVPIYEYECENSHRFDLRQSFNDDPVAACPVCDLSAKRLFRPVPVHFKGSGFYVNDYGRAGSGGSDSSSSDGQDTKDSGSKTSDSTAKSSDSTTTTSKESSPATAGKTGDSGDK